MTPFAKIDGLNITYRDDGEQIGLALG
jgi:hypothetical protein